MLQLLEDNLDLARVSGVDLDPVDDLIGKIGREVPDRVVPLSIARSTRLQTGFNVNASLDASCVLGGDPAAIDFADRAEALLPAALHVRCQLDGSLEGQGISWRSAFAAAVATASFARPLNSISPPHPPSPASSLPGSSSEMSLVRPVVGSK